MKSYQFLVKIDFRDEESISATGARVKIKRGCRTMDVFAMLGAGEVRILSLSKGLLTVYSPAGGVLPLYYTRSGPRISISNFPHLLIKKGDRVQLSGEVLANRLTSAGEQLYDPFVSIPRFEEGSTYIINEREVCLHSSSIGYVENANFDDIAELLLSRFKSYRNVYRSALIPLSGGYDSRLNLALALKFFEPGEITCLHEFKNEKEEHIADTVARVSGVELRHSSRLGNETTISNLSVSDEFILLAGLNRRNVLRWTTELNKHHVNGEEELIMGFGAEAHKGKFYAQITDVTTDSKAIFGCKSSLLVAAGLELGISNPEPVHDHYLSSSIGAAKALFPDITGQIDFIHYKNYVAASYGYRCRYFSDAHGIDFPNLDPTFLSLVFSLSRDDKENFKLVERLLAEVSQELNQIPFVSGNEKSTMGHSSIIQRASSKCKRLIWGTPDKGQLNGLSLRTDRPNSELTSKLRQLATTDSRVIRKNEAAMMFNYFSLLEDNYEVEYELV